MVKNHNRSVLKKLVFFSFIMFGFGYLLVPLYYKICEVTGINNFLEPDIVTENTQINFNRDLTLQLDANSRANMQWALVPVTKTIDFHPGELISFEYNLINLSNSSLKKNITSSKRFRKSLPHREILLCGIGYSTVTDFAKFLG